MSMSFAEVERVVTPFMEELYSIITAVSQDSRKGHGKVLTRGKREELERGISEQLVEFLQAVEDDPDIRPLLPPFKPMVMNIREHLQRSDKDFTSGAALDVSRWAAILVGMLTAITCVKATGDES